MCDMHEFFIWYKVFFKFFYLFICVGNSWTTEEYLSSIIHHNIFISTAPRCGDSVNRERQLQLAVAWNRVDIAESEIFTEESKWKVCWIFIPQHYWILHSDWSWLIF